jgi:hypothetical protein
MPGHYVHHIDPIITTLAGVHLWWYGLSYSLGFLNAHFFLRRHRDRLGLSLVDVSFSSRYRFPATPRATSRGDMETATPGCRTRGSTRKSASNRRW